jgi:PKD repeat protein
MKNHFVAFSILIGLLMLSAFIPQSNTDQSKDRQGTIHNSIVNVDPKTPALVQGMIHVKFKEGFGSFSIPGPDVVTGITSFDAIAARYHASGLVRRFTNRPIAKDSGLPDISRIHKLTFPQEYGPWEVARAFENDPAVEWAEPVPVCHMAEVPDDPYYYVQQHLPQIMAEQAWDIFKGDSGSTEVKVAIVDTGVEWTHEDLLENLWQNLGEDYDNDGHTIELTMSGWILDPGDLNGADDDGNGFQDDLIGWDFYEWADYGNGSDPDPWPGNAIGWHGTHVAGIGAGVTDNGKGISSISWNVKYMAVQIDKANDATYGYDGIIYAAENGADVISNSWGYMEPYKFQTGAEVIEYANALGSIVVCAAGNSNSDRRFYPASFPDVISAASVSSDDMKAIYSSFGPAIDVAAPGGGSEGGILSTYPGNSYQLSSGTSMATPMVSGLLALIKSYHPEWSKDQLTGQLLGTCDNIDAINPGFENLLGSGRINAYRALTETNVIPPQQFKFILMDFSVIDANNDGILAAGETAYVSVTLNNFTHLATSEAVTFTLTSPSDQVTVLNPVTIAPVSGDGYVELDSAFRIQVAGGSGPLCVEMLLTISSDIPVVIGQEQIIPVVVAPDGFFVYEKEENGWDQSGAYIKGFLEQLGYQVTYSNYFPNSLMGFDGAFLSMGNPGRLLDKGTVLTDKMLETMVAYANWGGKLYVEAGGMIGLAISLQYPHAGEVKEIFGLNNVINSVASHPMTMLTGNPGTICEGLTFTESTQLRNNYIDRVYPASGVSCPLTDNYLGNVSVCNSGEGGYKTFYLSYALAELKDENALGSRYNLLRIIVNYFGFTSGPGYMTANFKADLTYVNGAVEADFADISLLDEGMTVSSWQWDFQDDGIIDSEEQNPGWIFSGSGSYDVRLVISDGNKTDTVVHKDLVVFSDGIMVFEGIKNARDMSGAWMRDFLLGNNYGVIYGTEPLRQLYGLDAAFFSFGTSFGDRQICEDIYVSLIIKYLEGGGKVYLEGGDAIGYDQQGNTELYAWFGLSDANNGTPFTNIFDSLQGLPGSLAEGMLFNHTNQVVQYWIDKYFPDTNTNGIAAFHENNYADVAVQHNGENGCKTFCFSYALAELADGETTSREDLMWAILGYFDIITGTPKQSFPENEIPFNIFPNPSSGKIIVEISLPAMSGISLELFDLTGRKAAVIYEGSLLSGEHRVLFDASGLPAGIYIYELRAESLGRRTSGKLVKY